MSIPRTFKELFSSRAEFKPFSNEQVSIQKIDKKVYNNAHVKYYYDNYEDFIKYNLPSKGREWVGGKLAFNDSMLYRPKQLDDYIKKWYIDFYDSKNIKSPFMNEKGSINKTIEDVIQNSENKKLLPHQKFVGEHFSTSTDFGGGLYYHKLGSGKTLSSIITAEHNKNSYVDMTVSEESDISNSRIRQINQSTCHIIVIVPMQTMNQYQNEIIGNISNGVLDSPTGECVLFIDDETDENNYKRMRQYYTGSIGPDNKHISNNIEKLEKLENDFKKNKDEMGKLELNRDTDDDYIRKLQKFSEINANIVKNIKNIKNNVNKNIKYVYTIISHDTFLNRLHKSSKEKANAPDFTLSGRKSFDPSEYLYGRKEDKEMPDPSCFKLDRTLIIIDEIHKLISKEGIYYYTLHNFLFSYARSDKGEPAMKVILMSATPIYDSPVESGLLLNLIRPRIMFPSQEHKFNSFFISEENNLKNKLCYQYLASGYVSFSEGAHPSAFPFRRNIIKTHDLSPIQTRAYTDAIVRDLRKISSKNEKGNEGKDNVSSIKENKPNDDIINSIFTKPRQYSNIVFSDIDDEKEFERSEETGYSGLKNMLTNLKTLSTTKINKTETFDVDTLLTKFSEYSPKFSYIIRKILESAKNNEGPIFVYSKWVSYGIASIFEVLNMIPGWSMISDSESKMNARHIAEDNKTNNKFKYSIWSSEAFNYINTPAKKIKDTKVYTKNIQQLFNNEHNKYGDVCKVIFCTVTESINFKYISQIHITSSWWNLSEIEQAIGRGIRFGSHSNLEKDRQFVDVYLHCSTISGNLSDSVSSDSPNKIKILENNNKYNTMTIEQHMFLKSIKKNDINNQFELALKETAVDNSLNEYGNYVRFEEYIYDDDILKITKSSKVLKKDKYKILYDRNVNKYYIYYKNNLYSLKFEESKIVSNYEVEMVKLDHDKNGNIIKKTDEKSKKFENVEKVEKYSLKNTNIDVFVTGYEQYRHDIRNTILEKYKIDIDDVNSYKIYSLEENGAVKFYILYKNDYYIITIKDSDKDDLFSNSSYWPYKNAIVSNKIDEQIEWKEYNINKVNFINDVSSVSIIVKPNIKNFNSDTNINKFNFVELMEYAITNGEEKEVWEYFEDMAFKLKLYKTFHKIFKISNKSSENLLQNTIKAFTKDTEHIVKILKEDPKMELSKKINEILKKFN